MVQANAPEAAGGYTQPVQARALPELHNAEARPCRLDTLRQLRSQL